MGKSTNFYQAVYDLTRRIPSGKVLTYGLVATHLGRPGAARAVGQALKTLPPEAHDVPWHRVVNTKGEISMGGRVERPREQRRRLQAEGVVFDANDRIDLNRFLWSM